MQIFACALDPVEAASYIEWQIQWKKLLLEATQILYDVHHRLQYSLVHAPNGGYRKYNPNNRFVVWAATSRENYDWLVAHALALCARFRTEHASTGAPRDHACLKHIQWLQNSSIEFPQRGLTPFATAFDENELPRVAVYTNSVLDVCLTYRNYAKEDMAKARVARRAEAKRLELKRKSADQNYE